MEITEVKSLNKYLLNCYPIPIGIGSTATCYLTKDFRVLKVFRNTFNKIIRFERYGNFISHMGLVSEYQNDSYVAPDEMLIKNGKCVAYLYPYVDGKTLHTIKRTTLLTELFLENYDKLDSDTKEFSKSGLKFEDLHDKNIIYNKNYYMIDLDATKLKDLPIDDLYEENMRTINRMITDSLFKEDDLMILTFYNQDIDKLYNKALYFEHEAIKDFIEALMIYYPNIDTVGGVKLNRHRYMRSKINEYKITEIF